MDFSYFGQCICICICTQIQIQLQIYSNCEKSIFCIISRSEEAIRVGGWAETSKFLTNDQLRHHHGHHHHGHHHHRNCHHYSDQCQHNNH